MQFEIKCLHTHRKKERGRKKTLFYLVIILNEIEEN